MYIHDSSKKNKNKKTNMTLKGFPEDNELNPVKCDIFAIRLLSMDSVACMCATQR